MEWKVDWKHVHGFADEMLIECWFSVYRNVRGREGNFLLSGKYCVTKSYVFHSLQKIVLDNFLRNFFYLKYHREWYAHAKTRSTQILFPFLRFYAVFSFRVCCWLVFLGYSMCRLHERAAKTHSSLLKVHLTPKYFFA